MEIRYHWWCLRVTRLFILFITTSWLYTISYLTNTLWIWGVFWLYVKCSYTLCFEHGFELSASASKWSVKRLKTVLRCVLMRNLLCARMLCVNVDHYLFICVCFDVIQESSESANTTIEDEDIKGTAWTHNLLYFCCHFLDDSFSWKESYNAKSVVVRLSSVWSDVQIHLWPFSFTKCSPQWFLTSVTL